MSIHIGSYSCRLKFSQLLADFALGAIDSGLDTASICYTTIDI
jgi:hypothetical protein